MPEGDQPAERVLTAADLPSASFLYDVAVKRADIISAAHQEAGRRGATIFGFSSFLVAGAAAAVVSMRQAEWPAWIPSVASGLFALLYLGIAGCCFQVLRVRAVRILFDPVSVFDAIAGEPAEVAKARLCIHHVEPSNRALMAEVNRKGRYLQAAVVLGIVMASLIFAGGMVPTAWPRRTLMSQREPDRPKAPEPQTAQPAAPPRPQPSLKTMLAPIPTDTDRAEILLMNANGRRINGTKKP